MAFSNKSLRPVITLVTANSEEFTAMFLPKFTQAKQSIVFKVFPNEAYYFDTTNSLAASIHTNWINVDQETFIKATALRALGGYDYVRELFKDQL